MGLFVDIGGMVGHRWLNCLFFIRLDSSIVIGILSVQIKKVDQVFPSHLMTSYWNKYYVINSRADWWIFLYLTSTVGIKDLKIIYLRLEKTKNVQPYNQA
jgi:hypothetical protein